nr:unnamed protein product [Callosobruchus analis]
MYHYAFQTWRDNSKIELLLKHHLYAIPDFRKFLPTPDQLIYAQKRAPEEPDFVQVITEGPMEIRELLPLFVIPGLTGHDELEKMFESILYPTFLAQLPNKPWPLKKMAEKYAEKMKAICPKPIYNIVAVSWGGTLLVEVARLLQKDGGVVNLYFIDSAPDVVRATLTQLGEEKDDLPINALKRIFDISDEQLLQKLKSTQGVQDKAKVVVEKFGGSEKDKMHLNNALIALIDRLEQALVVQPEDTLILGKSHLIRPSTSSQFDACGLRSYCKLLPQIELVDGDHLSIIGSRATTDVINRTHQMK